MEHPADRLPDDPDAFEVAVSYLATGYADAKATEAHAVPLLRQAVVRRYREGVTDKAELADWSGLSRPTVIRALKDAGIEVGEEPEGPRRARQRKRPN